MDRLELFYNNCQHPGYVIEGYPLTTKNLIRVLRYGGGEPIDCVKVQYVMEIEDKLNAANQRITDLKNIIKNLVQ